MKMDVEGAEHSIVPKMASDGTLALVDVWLWECHHMPRSWHSPCHKLLQILKANGVRTVYEDPYPWTTQQSATPQTQVRLGSGASKQ